MRPESDAAAPRRRPRLAAAGTALGAVLAIASCAVVAQRAVATRFWDIDGLDATSLLGAVLAVAAAYAGALLLLAIAWALLARPAGAGPSWRALAGRYAVTQIAKYLPGNVLHFMGRHAAGRLLGVPHAQLAAAAAAELLLIAACASVAALPASRAAIDAVGLPMPLWALGALAVVALSGIAIAWPRLVRRGADADAPPIGWTAPRLVGAAALVAGFVAALGALAVPLVGAIAADGAAVPTPLLVASAAILAWFAGLITPGAPSGIGVRELVLLAVLGGTLGEREAAALALAFRAATFVGDLLFFALGLALLRGASRNTAAQPPGARQTAS